MMNKGLPEIPPFGLQGQTGLCLRKRLRTGRELFLHLFRLPGRDGQLWHMRYLPKGMFPPAIIKFGASSLPIAQLTVSSPTLGEKEVRDLAYFTVRPQLGTVPGAAPLPPVGGTIRQITVFLDQQQMQARGLSTGEIVKAVNAENVLIPAGDVNIGD